MNSRGRAASLLEDYLAALGTADSAALDALIGEHTLLENPFLNPSRLLGRREIASAHDAIREQIESLDFDLDHCLGDAVRAIASGRLGVTRRGEARRDFAVGLVCECDDRSLARLSLYSDTRNARRWSDRRIL